MRKFTTILLIFLLTVAAISCKDSNKGKPLKSETDTVVHSTEKATNGTPHDAVSIPLASETTATDAANDGTTLWQRIEIYINTSPKEQHPTLTEVNNTLGRGMYLDVKELWYLTQFNIKKKLSKGVSGLNAANFESKYEEQYDKAIAGGY